MIWSDDVSSEFAVLLVRSGWSDGRRFEIRDWVARLESEGFTSNPIAAQVLSSLGGLSILMPPAGINPYEHELRFDPLRAASGEADRIVGLHTRMFPLGEEVKNGNVLWSGNDGRFYFGLEFGLFLLGDSFGKAMDQLAFPTRPLTLCFE